MSKEQMVVAFTYYVYKITSIICITYASLMFKKWPILFFLILPFSSSLHLDEKETKDEYNKKDETKRNF